MEPDQFQQHVLKRVPTMTGAELAEIRAAFTLWQLKKHQFIIQPTFTAEHRTYVLQGALRSYVIDQEGIEHTVQFALEDW